MTSRALVATLLALAVAPSILPAQSCTTPNGALSVLRTCSVTTTVNDPLGAWAVPKLAQMTVSSTADLVLTPPTAAAYDSAEFEEPASNARDVTVKANATWGLIVAPNTVSSPSLWTGTNDATYGAFVGARTTKPSSDLLAGTTLGSGYLPFPTTNAGSIVLSATQPATSGTTYTVYFSTVWSYPLDRPGSYTLPFVFRLSMP
jgi:hypothetical protein